MSDSHWSGSGALRIVTIDGPAGCGKSTVARALAHELNGISFSSGAIYRAVTFVALEDGIRLDHSEEILGLLRRHELELVERNGEVAVRIDGVDPGRALWGSRVTREIHWVADDPAVRAELLSLQRRLVADLGAGGRPIIAEGRDMGTVVFPDAGLKIFLTASPEERARRRMLELREKYGERVDLEQVLEDVRRRDRTDSDRDVAPLKPAADAKVVDSTQRTVLEVVSEVAKGIPEDWKKSTPDGSTGS